MALAGWILRRLTSAVIVLFLASLLVFAGVHALPGNAAYALGGVEASPESIRAIEQEYGLGKPLPVQYFRWIENAVQGNLSRSLENRLPVARTIGERLPITLELAGLAVLFALVLGVPAGVVAATSRGSAVDYVGTGVALTALSIPHFALGLLFILLFAVHWHVLPASGYVAFSHDPLGNLQHMLLPALVLGSGLWAVMMRQLRSAMLESLGSDYIRTARAKGLGVLSVVFKHALRNSLITVVTVVGLYLGALISGAVVTEQVFLIPGFGKLMLDSVFARDYPVIEGVVLVSAAGYVAVNMAVDVVYTLIDPRIRASGKT